MEKIHSLPPATSADTGARLDKYLTALLAPLSRSRIQTLIQEGHVSCKGTTITSPKHTVAEGDAFTVTEPPTQKLSLEGENIPLDILYEDDHLIVINKPVGLAMHPGPGQHSGTLVHGLLYHCPTLSGINGVERPGIVHRLDKDTSGIVVIAKDDASHQHLSKQFSRRTMQRHYLALCFGIPNPAEGELEAPIGRNPRNRQKMAVVEEGQGKNAITHYEVLKRYATDVSLVRCTLRTGRTHQIRVHMAEFGYSLLGDPVYGRFKRLKNYSDAINKEIRALNRQMLHAAELGFTHPVTGQSLHFSSPPPEDFLHVQNLLTN
jgi:23S rRNA pseudouridine1911/1915/1917 synthase